MPSAGVEILGMILAVAGWLGVMVSCCLPMWRVVAYVGQNIVMAQVIWEGLWMSCVVQSTGQMHCRIYDSMLGLPHDLQAARALTVTALLLGVVGISLAVAGAKCTNCTRDPASKPRLVLGSGAAFMASGLLLLVAVCWTANVIILDFYNPLLEETQKREFGNSLYFGWAASCLLLLGERCSPAPAPAPAPAPVLLRGENNPAGEEVPSAPPLPQLPRMAATPATPPSKPSLSTASRGGTTSNGSSATTSSHGRA